MPPKGSKKIKQLPIPGNPTYPGKPEKGGLEAPQWEACRHILEGIYKTTEDGILIAEIFCDLPDRTDFADYYETIPEPECLNNVAQLLQDQAFPTPDKFFAQLLLIFLNAKHYNEDGSQLYADATAFEEQIWSEWRKYAAEGIFKGEPHLPKTQTRKGKKNANEPVKTSTPVPAPPPPPVVEAPKPIISTPAVASSSRISRSTPAAPLLLPTPDHPPRRGLTAADQEIVDAVDAKCTRWAGPVRVINGPSDVGGILGSGWWGDDQPQYEYSPAGKQSVGTRLKGVLTALTGYRDKDGTCLADTLYRVPPVFNLPYLTQVGPISLAIIRHMSDRGEYRSILEADMDMSRLFERARRWYYDGTKEYGHVLILQRLYNSLTAISPIPAYPTPKASTTCFAGIPAGPGKARATFDSDGPPGLGITHSKPITKERSFILEARHKGNAYRVGDYVHLINPDDPTRPIVGQVFKAFVPIKGNKTHHVSVCWYYRPEQTVHTADREFMDREVFKSGHICDHPVEDILEKITVQFFVKYVRGRSRPGEYYPGWPLYVCGSRYNDKAWVANLIKSWASCIPEELRQTDFMSLKFQFERIIEPLLFPSPFLSGNVQGPGHLGEPRAQVTEEDDEEKEKISTQTIRPPPPTRVPSNPVVAPQAISSAALTAARQSASVVPQQPPIPNGQAYRVPGPVPIPASTKTFGAMYGGQQAMDQVAYKEYLPLETSRLFDRDARQAVLWFSGPPLPSTQPSLQPIHSLEYLAYLAKRKRADEGNDPAKKARS